MKNRPSMFRCRYKAFEFVLWWNDHPHLHKADFATIYHHVHFEEIILSACILLCRLCNDSGISNELQKLLQMTKMTHVPPALQETKLNRGKDLVIVPSQEIKACTMWQDILTSTWPMSPFWFAPCGSHCVYLYRCSHLNTLLLLLFKIPRKIQDFGS